MSNDFWCSFCREEGRVVVDRANGCCVCTNCGVIAEEILFSGSCDCPEQPMPDYNELCKPNVCYSRTRTGWAKVFHFNEWLKDFARSSPSIPARDMEYIRRKSKTLFKRAAPNSQRDIIRILRSIKRDPAHKVEKTRWAYYEKTRFKKRRFTIYNERWQTILADLNPACALLPSGTREELLDSLRELFLLIEPAFEAVRHTELCREHNGTRGCRREDKQFKCRHNFPPYRLVVREFLLKLQVTQKVNLSAYLALLEPYPRTHKAKEVTQMVQRMLELSCL